MIIHFYKKKYFIDLVNMALANYNEFKPCRKVKRGFKKSCQIPFCHYYHIIHAVFINNYWGIKTTNEAEMFQWIAKL